MKKLFSIFIAALMLFSLAGCGEPEVRVEYVDNFRSINVERLTDDNHKLRYTFDPDTLQYYGSPRTIKTGTEKPTYCMGAIKHGITKLGWYYEQSSFHYKQEDWEFPRSYGMSVDYAILSVNIKEIKEYADFVRVKYDITFQNNMFSEYNSDLKYFDLDSSNSIITKYTDCIDFLDKNVDVVSFDPILYV